MSKALRVIKTVFLFVWLAAVVLCSHSCLMSGARNSTGAPGDAASAPASAAAREEDGAADPDAEGASRGDGKAEVSEAGSEEAAFGTVSFLGQEISDADTEVDFSSLSPAQVGEAVSILRRMQHVALIHLGSEETGALSTRELAQLHEAAPEAVLDYGFSLLGVQANLADSDLSFSHSL